MSGTDNDKDDIKNIFSYTRGEYWGGSSFPYFVYVILAVFPLTGFFGLDHLLFFSPVTAVQKSLVNIFGLGIWYFYDILQAVGDRTFIAEYGHSRPFFGPSGLAYQFFTDISTDAKDIPVAKGLVSSAIFFLLYFLTIFIPLGISSFLAGDINGGITKFILTIMVITMPFLFLWNIYEFITVLWNPKDTFEKGVPRIPPLTFFMDERMNDLRFTKPSVKAGLSSSSGLLSMFSGPLMTLFGYVNPLGPALQTACATVVPIAQKAEETVKAVSTAAEGVGALAGAVPAVASKVSEKVAAFSDPVALAALAKPMSGGAFLSTRTELDSWFFIALIVLTAGGFIVGASRALRNTESKEKNRQDDQPPANSERNDTPPNPRVV